MNEMRKLFAELLLLSEAMFQTKGSVDHTAFIVTPHGKFAQRIEWRDDMEKSFVLAALQVDMKAAGALRYGMIGEAWLATAPEAIGLATAGLVRPSQSSHRKEVVTIQVEDPADGKMFGYREIISTKRRGKVVRTLGELQTFPTGEGGELKGNMTDLLED